MSSTPASPRSRLAGSWRAWPLALAALALAGCDIPLIHPKGLVASEQRDLMITSLVLMLIVVVPVIILTLVFTFRYREGNRGAKYEPDWDHSTRLELIWWGVPIVIIVILASITWRTSHSLDPYRELKLKHKPIEIQVVAIPWKWLFIYPEQGIATVNHVRFPVDAPVNFKITAVGPMNSFWIPHLAGQIYAMEGMQTKLSVKADTLGEFPGYSSNFSGQGHNDMKFVARAATRDEFATWVDSVKKAKGELTRTAYAALAKPSIADPVRTWASFQPDLFLEIMMGYMLPPGAKFGDAHGCAPKSVGAPPVHPGCPRAAASGPMLDRHGRMASDSAARNCHRAGAGDSSMPDCPRAMPGDSAMADCPRASAAAVVERPRPPGALPPAPKPGCPRHQNVDSHSGH